MLFNIFGKKKNDNQRRPLKNYIPNCKPYYGTDLFVTINNDLNTEAFKDDKFAFMTYAYARRSIACFLYLQGHFDATEISYQQGIFQAIQGQTSADYQFQEDAGAAGLIFLQEYSNFFTKECVNKVTSLVIRGEINDAKSEGTLFPDATVIANVTKYFLS